MRATIYSIFLLSFLFFISCEAGEPVTIESETKDSIVPNEPTDQSSIMNTNQIKEDDSVQVDLNIQKINETDFNFLIEMQLYGDSWIVSPLEEDFPYGCMKIEFDDNEKLKLIDQILEKPKSKLRNDSNWNKPYSVISDHSVLAQKLSIISQEDFTVKGKVFFVLEPICNPYQIDFELIHESGHLQVKESPMRIAK